MSRVNEFLKTNIVASICMFLLGLLLLVRPDTVLSIVCYAIGVILIIMAISNLIRYLKNQESGIYLGLGLLSVVAALFMFFKYELIVSIIPFILGVFIIINSSIKIEYIIELKQNSNNKYINLLVSTILSMVIGIFLIFNPFSSTLTITRIIGAFIMVYALIDIYETILVKKELKKLV